MIESISSLKWIKKHSVRADQALARYHQIVGLYESLPNVDRDKDVIAKFEKRLADVGGMFDVERKTSTYAGVEEAVHELELRLIQLLPEPALRAWINVQMRFLPDDLSSGHLDFESAWANQRNGKKTVLSAEKLRAFALEIIKTRWQALAERAKRSEQRSSLVKKAFKGWLMLMAPLTVYMALFVGVKFAADRWVFSGEEQFSPLINTVGPFLIEEERASFADEGGEFESGQRGLPRETAGYQILTALSIFVLAAMVGASGALVSVYLRIQKTVPASIFSRDVSILHEAGMYVGLTPLCGAVFAIVLSAMFAGHLIAGGLFPNVSESRWYFTFWSISELPKWMVWAFLAGFSERFVPDLLSKVAKRAENEETSLARETSSEE